MKKMKRWASVLLILCMLLAGTPAPAESGGALTGTPTAEQSAEPENTATAEPENTATAEPENTATAEPENTATAEPTNTATAEPTNTATAEPENTATAEPKNTATAEPENTATAEPANTATAEPENTATAEPENTATAEPENTATPIPTDAAEVKTIASFEAFAPEGFAVPQGTPETGLGLPASLNVQFADGAAGEVAVAWQCAAGYDPNAEAGGQFAFAAVLPQGYALAEGVSLPQILVTLTPPLANAMLMAEGIVESGDGWTLFDDGKLTVTDKMASDDIPPAIWNAVTSIEVTGDAYLYLWSSFSGGITVKAGGSLTNSSNATLSADVTLDGGRLENLGTVTGSVTVKAGGELFSNFTGKLSCDVTVETGGSFQNHGTITGGDFSGQVYNNKDGTITGGDFSGQVYNNSDASITGGDFTDATVENYDGSVTGGVFNGFKLENGVLTITGTVDLKEDEDALAPLTIGLGAESIQSIIVEANATFNAGNNAVDDPVTCNGTITGGTFTDAMVDNEGGTITGGVFDDFTMDSQSKELTITGAVDLDAEDALAPLTIALGGESIKSVTIAAGGSFDAGSTTVPVPVTNNGGGEISGGTFSGHVTNNGGGEISGGTFSSRVENSGTITNGTFSDHVENTGKITNGAFSGVVENSGTISGEITIAKGGSLNNHADGTISGDITIAEYGSLNNNAGGTISSGTFTVHGGMNNQGTITGSATFEILGVAALTNDGTISGGTFTGRVTNDGEITGGTFSGAEVYNKTSGKITGGTFGNGMVVNNRGSIADGDFRGATVTNYDDGTVTGGTFDKFTVATDEDGERTITITGAIDMDSANALHPLTIGLDAVKSVTIAAGGSFDAGSTTVSAHVFNYGEIGGGTFREGTVYNRNGGVISAGTFDTTVYNQGSKIAGGTFNATVNNADGGEISGGTFGSGVYNKSSITGAITLTSEQSLINDGGDISGNITFTEGGYLANSGKITGGAISGATVSNRSGGIIFDGTFTDATVTNDGIIAYGDFRAAEVTNRDGSITGGIFKNCTLKDGELTITQNVDLREDADALAPLSLAADPFAKLEIASGCAFNAGDNTVSVYVINNGTITGGTFENSLLDNSGTISGGTFNNGDVLNNPGGTISGGAFSGCTYNFGAITGGTFAEIVLTGASARVQGVDGSVPTLNGPIENGMGGSILQPCNFGANASVVENRGVIEVPATVNNIPQSLRYGEKTLEQLKKINPNDVWFEQAADGTLKRVAESATVDLVSRTYVSRNLPAVEAPQAEIDFDGETLTVSLDTSSALPEGLQMGELDVLFTCGGKSGIVRDAFANGNSCTVTLSALGNALGLTLPADNGSGDASLRVSLSAEGKEDGYNWGVAELTVPERPAATAPGAEKRAHETTDRSIQMLDADMLAEYDFGVAVKADALPQEPALADEDGDGLITGLAGDTEYCLYFRKKATDGAFRSAWFSSADVSARTNRSIPLAAGVETAEYAWMPDFTLQPSDIAEETVFARVEGGGEQQAIPENGFALTITGENGAAVEGSITNAGTYTVKVALDCDNYVLAAGGDSFTITVRPLDLSSEDVVLRVEGPLTVGYTGASVYPQIGGNVLEVKVGGVDRGALPADCFTIEAVEGRNNVNAGEAYLTIVGQGNATGKTELAYTITARNIAGAGVAVEPIPGQTYTGSAIEPKVTVKDGGRALAEGTDYTVAYANNTAVGTATVTITGMDNYTGTRTVTFAIRAVEKDNEDEASEQDKQDKQEETAAEALTPAQQAEQLIGGRAVDGTVTDRHGEAMPYVPSTEEVTDEETQEMLQRTLVITADPVRDENGEIVLRDGAPVYEQRNLHLSRGLLDALAELGYTHIRFVLGDAALEWPLASMTGDGYTVRLAPMEADELSQAEKDATGAVETLTGSYRARVTAMIEGEEVDVTNAIPSLTAIFDAASVRELAGDEMAQLLLVPNDGEPETQVSTVQYIEETDTEKARYEAPLMESGLFVLTLQ